MNEEELLFRVKENLPKGFHLVYEPVGGEEVHDGWGKLTGPAGETATFALEIKQIHRKETLMAVRRQIRLFPENTPALLVCNRLTSVLAEYCAESQINFIDTAGNACVRIPGLCLWVEGRYEKKSVVASSRFAEGVMKLLFVLLTCPDALNETYRNLTEKAGISLGMVSKAFTYLEEQRFFRKSQAGRRLMNEEELMTLWLKDYATALRPKLDHIGSSTLDGWDLMTLKPGEYWGGEAAAARLSGGYLQPERVLLFTPFPLSQRRAQLKLKPGPEKEFQLVSCFWGKGFKLNEKAQAMLCVAELLSSWDDRNREVAKSINDKYLHLNESDLFSY
ncbi:hypothetical protein EGM70_16075 [Enterobacteriaceae bacterium 89]|nr:hypothetical protein [Enterobacteriaceae bacterium 89]